MRSMSRGSYASLVDVVLTRGYELTRKVGIPYDIHFIAKAMWMAYPFMRIIDGKKVCTVEVLNATKRPELILYVDFMTAVQAGSKPLVRACLDRMKQLQRKMKFRMTTVCKYPIPTILRDRGRTRVVKAEHEAIKRERTFEQQVDDAIDNGIAQTRETNRRHGLSSTYDIIFFVQALWRAKPFMDFALNTNVDDKKERKYRVLRQDFLYAVYGGKKGAVTGMLAGMVRMGKKRKVTLAPMADVQFPTPRVLLN